MWRWIVPARERFDRRVRATGLMSLEEVHVVAMIGGQ
ncbi:hypothetical protein SAMN05444581_101548 [Methylocapsa palsarum]|uniref:Transposase n=1 Tax=Methylocapsa palsarum TaxID=1612308 RepID=A0A1I3WDT8_9HYPH|nr:hypothetical protein SAMN05444581_101548 [Methylocapsa palsarum]